MCPHRKKIAEVMGWKNFGLALFSLGSRFRKEFLKSTSLKPLKQV